MNFFDKSSKILGMNARNLSYIMRFNTTASKKFADDKFYTKQFLESRGIGVAKLYHLIKNHQQLTPEFFRSLPDSFVIKPNRGFAGAGIFVISKRKKKTVWESISGKRYDADFLYRQCIDILDGKYSISGTHDDIIFEEKLDPHADFRTLTNSGLPDIRVIVFNMVPVMAMLRVPTAESDGKANMELGAIAMGIDLGTGKTNGAALHKKFIKVLPNGESAMGFLVPFWDEIMHSVSKIQQVTKIGFLGVDLVITKSCVKVLEVNARPGLKIQIANKIPLKVRLEKVSDIKVLTPKDGVSIAKKLFSTSLVQSAPALNKPIIGITESVILNSDPPQKLVAKVDLFATTNLIASRHLDSEERLLDISLKGKRIKLPVKRGRIQGADMILAGKFLSDFYIDPAKKYTKKGKQKNETSLVDEKMLLNIDHKICEIDKQIKLLAYINPQNLAEQKKVFLSHPEFSPRFIYRDCTLDFSLLRNELKRIPEVNHPLFPLYKSKKEELEWRLMLLESRNTLDFGAASVQVFGSVSRTTYREALAFIEKNKSFNHPDTSSMVGTKESISILKEFLKKHNLGFWKIKILKDSVSDIQVTKRESILLKEGVSFESNRLKALLVHEIGTHVFRFENGKRQPLRIFERGTRNYLQTEEGLAVWNQNQLGLDLGNKFLSPALLSVAIYMAGKMSFQDLFHYLKTTFAITDDLAWKCCVKSKRGLANTELKTAFTKDAIYFAGNREIEKFVASGGSIEMLYAGKITVQDLKYLKYVKDLKKANFLLK